MKIRPALFATVIIFVASLGAQPASAQDEPTADTVLATIDGTEITLGHMIALRSNLPPNYAQLEPQVLFDGILNQLVQQTLLAQSLEDGPSQRSQLTIENETRAIIAGEVIDDVMGVDISEEEIQAAYQRDYVEIDPATEYNAAHILVKTKEEADAVIQKLNEGSDFGDLAREFSTGPSGASGGELGWFAKGVMMESFFDAVSALEAGEVSEPVQTKYGWHVIKLLATRSQEQPALDEVREQLEEHLRQKVFDARIAELEEDAKIERADTTGINAEILNDLDLLEN